MEMNEITEKVIGCAFTVSNELGSGFLEKIYENALKIELELSGLKVEQQAPITVHYKGQIVGEYFADLLVEDEVIVELKAIRALDENNEAQVLNYLNACQKQVGLLLNFGTLRVQIKRLVNNFENT